MRGLELPEPEFDPQRKDLLILTSQIPSGSPGLRGASRLHLAHPKRKYASKTHYCIVFKERGITIGTVPRFHDVMRALLDTVTGAF